MVTGHTHVVGAGIAGLAAALAVTGRGGAVTLHEAAPQAGGRCRTIEASGFAHDNGTHVLFTANRHALALIEAVGTRENWIEPEPDGFPVWDAHASRLARIGLSPWSWRRRERRPEGLGLGGLVRLARLSLPLPDRPVREIVGTGPLARSLIEPLTVAVLNTPAEVASSRRLGIALRRLARPGGARLLVARRGLSADLIQPALTLLRRQGGAVRHGERLRAVVQEKGCAAALVFGDRRVALGTADRVILALPPHEIARLLPGLPVPEACEPILNIHYRVAGPNAPRFVGLLGALAQWALLREDHVSVTVSAAGSALDEDADALALKIWREIAPALAAIGHAFDALPVPPYRVVKERRATIRQAAGPLPQLPVRPLANLALAGDWLGAWPATIESAVRSGERAADIVSEVSRAPAADPRPLPAGGLP